MQSWQAGSAYLYILHLDRPALAWEYLRRNPEYRRQWHAGELTTVDNSSTRWGCAIAESPDLDARVAQPCWTPDPPDVIRITASEESKDADQVFSVWQLPGRRNLSYTGRYFEAFSSQGASRVRLRMDNSVRDGVPYAYVIRADRLLHERLQTVCRFAEHSRRSRVVTKTPKHSLVNRHALTHARTLQAVDGTQAGASQREIASAIFGAPEVRKRWLPDGELRAQARYLIHRGLKLVDGGYRSLLTHARQQRQGEFSV